MPPTSHWQGPIKRKEISPSSRRLGGAEDQSYLQQSASGGTGHHYWTFWAADKLGVVTDRARFHWGFSLGFFASHLLIYFLLYMYKYTYIVVYIHTCIYVCICVYIYTHIHICVYLYTYTHIYTYVCVYIARVMREWLCSSLKRLVWMEMTQQTHINRSTLYVVGIKYCAVKRGLHLYVNLLLYYVSFYSSFFLINFLLLHWVCHAQGEWSLLQLSKRVKSFHLKSLHVDDITPRFPSEGENDRDDCSPPPRIIWLIAKGPHAGAAEAAWRSD